VRQGTGAAREAFAGICGQRLRQRLVSGDSDWLLTQHLVWFQLQVVAELETWE